MQNIVSVKNYDFLGRIRSYVYELSYLTQGKKEESGFRKKPKYILHTSFITKRRSIKWADKSWKGGSHLACFIREFNVWDWPDDFSLAIRLMWKKFRQGRSSTRRNLGKDGIKNYALLVNWKIIAISIQLWAGTEDHHFYSVLFAKSIIAVISKSI